MKGAIRLFAGFLFLTGICSALGSSAPGSPESIRDLTLDEYKAELHRIQADAAGLKGNPDRAADLAESIASQNRVTIDGKQFLVDAKALKLAIGEYKIASPERRENLLLAIDSRLSMLSEGAERYSAPTNVNARSKLDEILARKEFEAAKGPTLLDIWSQRVQDWIARMLFKLFGKLPSRQSRNDTLAWILIAIALCALAIWIKRRAGRREPESVRIPIPFAPSAKGWRTWLAEARVAAGESRWRDAVHLAYWAGISNLEEHGAWIPDRARTPREYLQLISSAHPGNKDLRALTQRFELIWYGNTEAAPSDFTEALRHLEVLGCR